MGDFRLIWLNGSADLSIADDDIEADEGLRTAVMLSLFTDRRADEGDELLGDKSDKRGWLGDILLGQNDRIGSKLWQLDRAKPTRELQPRAERFAKESVQWMLDDRVTDSVEVTTEVEGEHLYYLVEIARPDGTIAKFKFAHVWEGEAAVSDPYPTETTFTLTTEAGDDMLTEAGTSLELE